MMRVKSPPSELILEIIKSNNSLSFFKEFEKRDNFIIVKILFCLIPSHCFLIKRGKKTKQNKYLYFNNIQIGHFTHYCNLLTKFNNEMYKSFARIHNLIIRF